MTATNSISQHSPTDTHEKWFEDAVEKINEALQHDKHLHSNGDALEGMRDSYKSWMDGCLPKFSKLIIFAYCLIN